MKKYNDVFLYKLTRPIITFLFKVLYRPKIVGVNNIPKKGRIILAGNHNHNLDGAFLISSLLLSILQSNILRGFLYNLSLQSSQKSSILSLK